MAAAIRPQSVCGVRHVAKRYRGVLLDQFGVLHDGKVAYPEAVDAVKQWAAAGTKIFILSNSSRRSHAALEKIEALGFPRSCFAGALTSGEVTHSMLATRPTPAFQALGTRCLHITWAARGAVDISSLGLQVTTAPEEAEFVLAHGMLGIREPGGGVQPCSMDELQALLRRCGQARPCPMVVANPDFVTVSGKDLVPMPGSLGRFYETECGGEVWTMGKPAPVIYKGAMEELQLDAQDILMVGDSMHHDIAGAQAAGVDSLFVCGGIHEKEMSTDELAGLHEVDSAAVARVAANAGLERAPTYAIGRLRW